MNKIAVFCGSSNGSSIAYKEGAIKLGEELVKRGITLVYGGASVGIMGILADTMIQAGGQVIGVIPKLLAEREISHKNLTQLITVESMHERKGMMMELADGFIALPGGPGTLEEFFEVFTWSQIGLHQKPCGVLNVNHYYDLLISMFDHMKEEQFLQEQYHSTLIVDQEPAGLLEKFANYIPPIVKTYSK